MYAMTVFHMEAAAIVSDGSYIIGDREYIIENGVVTNVWSLPDENQLSFEEL